MNGLQELLDEAFELWMLDDDLVPCCTRPSHRAEAMMKALEIVITRRHEQHADEVGSSLAACPAYPCRLWRER